MMRVVSSGPEVTAGIAADLARQLPPGSVVLLYGDLGAGKTAFVRGMATGLQIPEGEVSSPTFTLVQEYRGGQRPLFHADLYRLREGEVDDVGIEELGAGDGVLAVEWAERLPRPMADATRVRLWHGGGDVRVIDIEPATGLEVRLRGPAEVWLRGPLPGVAAPLQPVVHALLQVREDAARALAGLDAEALWERPGGAASLGFHARHLVGSLDRLLTYARGESLAPEQFAFLKAEGTPGDPRPTAATLLDDIAAAIDAAIAQVVGTPETTLWEPRYVGRAALPTTVFGLLVHAAEHSARHAGQMITTARVVARPM
jgi:tRNA threonylcarbamoyl adenosine modification protein YjeE